MKASIKVYETVTYEHEIIAEVDENKIESILDKAERKSRHFDGVLYVLERENCKIIETHYDEDGMISEIEIPEYEKIK